MNTHTKIKTDRVFGKPVVIMLNMAARCLGFLLRIDHSLSRPPKTIAVSKFMGMGNIIQSTPLLQTLRKNFPEARITFITRAANREIIGLLPFIDNALFVDDKNLFSLFFSTHKVIFRLWEKKSDIYIDLETYSHFSTFISTLSLSRNRFSFYHREDHIRLGIYTHMMFFNNNAPISNVYLQMARFIGCMEIITNLFYFNIANKTKDQFLQRLNNEFGMFSTENLILINPNSSNLRSERKWPAENFSALVTEMCLMNPDLKFGFIGSAEEKNYVGSIIAKIPVQNKAAISDFSGKLDIAGLVLLCDISKCMITNDSGPMHIALALEKQTIALFGPHYPSISKNHKNLKVIYKNLYCSPCVHEFLKPPCRGNNICMKEIRIGEVKNILVSLIKNNHFTEEEAGGEMIYSCDDNTLGIIRR